jgi:hypothetical protein
LGESQFYWWGRQLKVGWQEHILSRSGDGLEAGTFQFLLAQTGQMEMAAWELAVLLEGIDLSRGRPKRDGPAVLSAARRTSPTFGLSARVALVLV